MVDDYLPSIHCVSSPLPLLSLASGFPDRGELTLYVSGHLGAVPCSLSFSPIPCSLSLYPLPSDMPSEIDPSTIGLTPHDLSKLSKKDLAKHLSTLQEMYVERGRKYGT
jgi:hypothetical protein